VEKTWAAVGAHDQEAWAIRRQSRTKRPGYDSDGGARCLSSEATPSEVRALPSTLTKRMLQKQRTSNGAMTVFPAMRARGTRRARKPPRSAQWSLPGEFERVRSRYRRAAPPWVAGSSQRAGRCRDHVVLDITPRPARRITPHTGSMKLRPLRSIRLLRSVKSSTARSDTPPKPWLRMEVKRWCRAPAARNAKSGCAPRRAVARRWERSP